MTQEQDLHSRILRALRLRPRGLTIAEIARQIDVHRNLVSKTLEIMHIAGLVDVRPVGSAKVYSVAQRVPLSAFLCFTRNLILVLDSVRNIVQVNDQFLKLAGCEKSDLIGRNLRDLSLPILKTPEAAAVIEGAGREQVITDVPFRRGGVEFFYEMQVIPTRFDDGDQGLTIVLEDITEKKKYLGNMEFLARSAMEFVELPQETDVYGRIAELLVAFVPGGQVFVQSYDESRQQFVIRSVMDGEFREALTRMLGRDPVGMTFPLDRVFLSPFLEDPDEMERGIRELPLAPDPGEGVFSFYDLAFGRIPKEICREITIERNFGKVYLTFLSWKGRLLGDVGIFMTPDQVLEYPRAVESFVRQASIAISKRMTEEELRESENRFRNVLDLFPVPAAIIDPDGGVGFLNRTFGEVFGYTGADLTTVRDWIDRAFPEERRESAMSSYGKDARAAGTGGAKRRTFAMRDADGNEKMVATRMADLGGGHRFVTVEDITDLRMAHTALLLDGARMHALAESLATLNRAFDAAANPIAVTDPAGRLTHANPAFLAAWRYDAPDAVRGRPAAEFWQPAGEVAAILAALSDGGEWRGELLSLRSDATTFPAQVAARPATGPNGRIAGLVFSVVG
jgi:PAS domain S-box-containing protein